MSGLLTLGIILSATDKLSPVVQSATGNIGTLDNKVSSVSANITKLGTASLALGTAISMPLKSAFNDFQELSKAQGELATLGIGKNGLDSITESAINFSNTFAGTTTPEFVAAAYDIKSGISSLSDTAVGEFTKIAAMTASATKSSVGQMTSLFATGYGIYKNQFDSFGASTILGWNKLSAEEKDIKFGEYFSAGIASSVQAFKTDGAQMSAALSNLGATATSAGIDFAEQLSVLGLLQKTMSGSEAATKYRSFLGSAYSAGQDLGLSFTDANNQLLSMPEIIGKIKDKYGEQIDEIEGKELKDAFGTDEAVALIKLMYKDTDLLTESISQANKALGNGLTITEQMAKAANQGKEWDLLNQQLDNTSTLLGESFAPIALEVAGIIGEAVISVTSWIKENKDLTSTITTTIAIGAGLLTVLGSIGVISGAVGMAMPFLAGGFGLVSSSLGVLAGAMKIVTAVFASNPIGASVAIIAGLAYAIYENWEPLSTLFVNLWQEITSASEPFFNWIENKIGTVSSVISSIGSFFGFGSNELSVSSKKETSITPIEQMENEVKTTGVQNSNSMIYQNKQDSSSRVIKNEPTYNITVSNPNSDVDVQRAIKDMERRNRNKTYEDLD